MTRPLFLSAVWRRLVMLNFDADPAILRDRTPAGVELDQFNGRTFVSMVGFRFEQTRVLGLPIPFHCNFDEVNLRFYVRRKIDGQWRRGVVFVKEIVPRAAIAWVARTFYNENYIALQMRSSVPSIDPDRPTTTSYEWRSQGRWHRIAANVLGRPSRADGASQESFITEHYWGYARQRDGSTVEYQVEHPPWSVWRAAATDFDVDVASQYGAEFRESLSSAPVSAFVADGSAVAVRWGGRLTSSD